MMGQSQWRNTQGGWGLLYTLFNEIRICSVDAGSNWDLRQVKAFMDKNSCKRVVYDVFLTRNQNGNTELSKLDCWK